MYFPNEFHFVQQPMICFLAALAALYPPWILTDWLTYWLMVLDLEPSRPNQTKPTWPIYHTKPWIFRSLTKPYQTYLNYLSDLLSWHTWGTCPPDKPTHLTYVPICPTHLPDLLNRPYNLQNRIDNHPEPTDNLPKPPDNLPEPTDNLSHYRQYRHHNLDQLSHF